ncbi:MAG: hypothetical protein QM401_07385 [Bacillota bacterium]|nr:hypothetical protein [Bacillota bacterium]
MFKSRKKRKNKKILKKIFKEQDKQLSKSNKILDKRNKSVQLFNEAHKIEKLGNLDKALSMYRKNIRLYGDLHFNTDHYKRPAIILEKMGRFQEALDICEEALSLPIEHRKTRSNFDREFKPRRNRLIKKAKT